MINKQNFKELLEFLGFKEQESLYIKSFENESYLKVDFEKEKLIYPKNLKIHEKQTLNFSSAENMVVFEAVYQLLNKGYKPENIELEPKWKVGHGASGGRADILVRDQEGEPLLIIECKTYGKEFDKAWRDTLNGGGQLFSYAQQISKVKFLCLYASEFKDGKLLREQRIISHRDNDEILKSNKNLKSYRDASNVEERFKVWKDTYQLEFTQKGIFEENIQPYQIGKTNYTLEIDTRPIQEEDKKGKYHRFRTILRQHNIARRETAFEVLVNLFLAKIVDEEHNRDDLKFYWKGIAYDNYFDFVDRLQNLYRTGMDEFLKEDVTYISNEEIDSAFWAIKGDENATKETIQNYFRQLKFFSNNAFSLINVHNEELFNRNTKVLIELVQMWQGLRLKSEEPNQFLGDMFEYFLDNSIKQSEGQFFTPLPITRFIVSSIPLEEKVKTSSKPIKAIDYACGSGHFLIEYAHQIQDLVKKYKSVDVKRYYENSFGIEKEDRLAKIAKVSSFMHGQDGIRIFDEDALADIDEVEDESFDILIANPPFAVEGFLLTLSEEDKKRYELIKTTELNSNTNNIQCFFIERAKQLIKPAGVVGIIVPSSILSNTDTTHIATREIILKYFDIVSIVELGSGTFGKTGTNTVVLFLKRKAQRPEPAKHYFERVEAYFRGYGEENQNIYQDLDFIKNYCNHLNLPFEEYKKLFGATTDKIEELEELFKNDIFIEYKKDFDSSTHIKNLKKKKSFKEKSKEEQKKELNSHLINHIVEIEKDKLLYFILAYTNSQKVLIIKSPKDNKAQKKFLGYEWSGAKGQEGIKYYGGTTVNDIITPLFNPKDREDKSKISYLIQQNFLGNEIDLKGFEEYKDLIAYRDVVNILDFSRKDFTKNFSLTPKKEIYIKSKWKLVKLGKVVKTNPPKSEIKDIDINTHVSFIEMSSVSNSGFIKNKVDKSIKEVKKGFTYFKEDDILIAKITPSMENGKCCIAKKLTNNIGFGSTEFHVFRTSDKLSSEYLFILLNRDIVRKEASQNMTGSSGHRRVPIKFYSDMKIPLPPKDIQQKIVDECEIVDNEVQKAEETIKRAKEEIENKVKDVFNMGYEYKKLNDIALINPSKKELKNLDKNTIVSFIEMSSVSNDGFIEKKVDRPYKELRKGSFTYFAERDIIIAKITPSMENGKCAFATKLTNKIGIGSSEFHVIRVLKNLNPKFLFILLNREVVRKEASKNMTGSSGHRRVPAYFYENFKIPIPPLSKQKALIDEVEKLEAKINQAKTIIEGAKERKEKIMEKYL